MKLAVRLPLLLAGSVMAASVAFAGWVHVTMEGLTGASAETDALHQLAVAHRALDITGSPGTYGVLNDPSVPAPLAQAVASGQRATYRVAEPPVLWAAEPAAGGVLAVQVSWEPWRAQQRALEANLVGGVLGLGAATAAASVLFSRRLGRRLQSAEDAAARIAAGELDVRVGDVVSGGDEVASLAGTIDALAVSMQQRIESEKRVTADIAHDLRTPVTGMVTAAQLLGDDRPAQLVRNQANRLWRLTEDLLEVARLDQAEQRLDLAEISTAALARAGIASADADTVGLTVVADAVVSTDARRVQRVLANLLANAAKHGRPPVVVTVDGRSIIVGDAGPGYPDDLLADGPQRFRTGAADRGTGHGLGLTIAIGQARALGASLVFSNAPGATATLTLPGE